MSPLATSCRPWNPTAGVEAGAEDGEENSDDEEEDDDLAASEVHFDQFMIL